MTPWQKRARMGVAAVGIVSAVVVYAAMGRRKVVPAPPVLQRLDPKAIIETTSGFLQQVRGVKQDFTVASDRQLTYDNGSTRLIGVRISVKNRGSRDFTVSAKEALSGEHEKTLQLSGDIHLVASDGFELTTEKGSFNQDDAIVRADGPIAFKKGGMKGAGSGMTYDNKHDVLSIAKDAQVTVSDDAGHTTMDFHAGSASLDRGHDVLQLQGMVHVMRNEQVIDTDAATAHMNAADDVITAMELRGNSRVEGGSDAFDSMSARDINLYYSDDGQKLQHLAMSGGSAIALSAKNGAGRQFLADVLDIQLADDGSIQKAVGQHKFSMVLPATDDLPARSIHSENFDASGEAGKGLTGARFTDAVVYREEARKGTSAREAHAGDLRVTMSGNAISTAEFRGSVTFTEKGLEALAGEAHYNPGAGSLALMRGNDTAAPSVTDDRIRIEAQTIDVALDTRMMSAKDTVKTTLFAAKSGEGAPRLPGLLKQGESAHVNADALEYDGSANSAMYTGNASLWQGETAIRADQITLDQGTGDLTATGNARSALSLDTGTSTSRADEIRYDDMKHVITFGAPGSSTAPPDTSSTAVAALPVGALAQMSGPQGDLHAGRIDAFLGSGGSQLQRLEAYTNVTMKVDTRTATGGRLTYHADAERYDMTGTAAAPVLVVESCRQTTGKSLTFFKSTDRIIVDGNEEIRTQTKSGGACPATPARGRAGASGPQATPR